MTARSLYAALVSNTDALYAGTVTDAEFRTTNRSLWAQIEAAGCRDAVLSAMRRSSN